jgi:hypothetical protein
MRREFIGVFISLFILSGVFMVERYEHGENEFWAGFSKATTSRAKRSEGRPVVTPTKPTKKVARATRLKRRILHTGYYARDNSDAGMRAAAAKGIWIDRDLQGDAAGNLIGTHWANPNREGFTIDGRPVNTPFSQLSPEQISRLRDKNGYGIDDAPHAIALAKKLGNPGIEFEAKRAFSQRAFNQLAVDARREWGPDWQKHVQVKSFSRGALLRAKIAGFRTTLIGYRGNPNDLVTNYIDTYRPAR